MKVFNIVPECNVDTRVAEILAKIKYIAGHKHGKGNVSNELETALKNNIALGIVDEDPNKGFEPKYFIQQFKIIKKENNLILKKHNSLNQYLIVICPEIEHWLNENAISVNTLPKEYNLPNNLKGFKQLCKSKDIRKNFQFDNFIKKLVERKASGIITLQTWLKDFLLKKNLV
jgi:hypothetical protein